MLSLLEAQTVRDIREKLGRRNIPDNAFRSVLEMQLRQMDLGYLPANGDECFILERDDSVVAIEYVYQRGTEYLDSLVRKHNILNCLFPQHFPKFIAGVSSQDSEVGYAYTIREKVHKMQDVPEYLQRRNVLEIVGELNRLGLLFDLDPVSTNFCVGVTDMGQEMSTFYLDKITDSSVYRRWDINKIGLRDFALRSGVDISAKSEFLI